MPHHPQLQPDMPKGTQPGSSYCRNQEELGLCRIRVEALRVRAGVWHMITVSHVEDTSADSDHSACYAWLLFAPGINESVINSGCSTTLVANHFDSVVVRLHKPSSVECPACFFHGLTEITLPLTLQCRQSHWSSFSCPPSSIALNCTLPWRTLVSRASQ